MMEVKERYACKCNAIPVVIVLASPKVDKEDYKRWLLGYG